MTAGERCDEILRMIDEALGDGNDIGGADVSPSPVPAERTVARRLCTA